MTFVSFQTYFIKYRWPLVAFELTEWPRNYKIETKNCRDAVFSLRRIPFVKSFLCMAFN